MKKLRELRKEQRLTMKELGRLVGVSEAAISQYESGKRQPDLDTLQKLTSVLNTSIDYLVTGSVPLFDGANFTTSYRTGVPVPDIVPEPLPEFAWILDAYDSAPAHIRRIVDVALEPFKEY